MQAPLMHGCLLFLLVLCSLAVACYVLSVAVDVGYCLLMFCWCVLVCGCCCVLMFVGGVVCVAVARCWLLLVVVVAAAVCRCCSV